MNNFRTIALALVLQLFLCLTPMHGQEIKFEETETFYPYLEEMTRGRVTWGYMHVPENWDTEEGKYIKFAVAIIKNTAGLEDPGALVFVQGGPGAGSINNFEAWMNYPTLKTHDLILFDARGTGLSEPKLCESLSRGFVELLAKDVTVAEEEQLKIEAVMDCQKELLNSDIDVTTYNSLSVAKDMNALQTVLGYQKWSVYGVSYGTYISQVYAAQYPEHVENLILDSSVNLIEEVYELGTGNYIQSLKRVFDYCENDPYCKEKYADLERVYVEVVEQLEKEPITVPVDKNMLKDGTFTFNASDFKLILQNALYNPSLIEMIPVLIYEFKNRNESAISNLVPSIASYMSEINYGVFFSMHCNETLPNNDIEDFRKDEHQYKDLKGGIPFIKADFKICEQWNATRPDSLLYHHDLTKLAEAKFPILLFSGSFDPITPDTNGDELVARYGRGHHVIAKEYSHTPSFTKAGWAIIEAFMENPSQKPDPEIFANATKIGFAQVAMNDGMSKMAESIGRLDILFLAPLAIAIILVLVFMIGYTIKLIRKKYTNSNDKLVRLLSIFTSILGILTLFGLFQALQAAISKNYFILAFGLPEAYTYVFIFLKAFIACLLISLLFFIFRIKKIQERSLVFTVLFSNMLIVIYLLYWNIV